MQDMEIGQADGSSVAATVFGKGAMPFETIAGLPGKVYVPEKQSAESKKHRCRDCYNCQRCSDDRCNVCRGGDMYKSENMIACCMPKKNREDVSSNAEQKPTF